MLVLYQDKISYFAYLPLRLKIMEKPKKRPKALAQVSEEHYDLLFLGWKISEGLRNNIEPKRIKAYADWFKVNYLEPHFEIEKEYVFPILGFQNVRIKKALANHRRLIRLFNDTNDLVLSINRIEEEIGRFVRFEERILYPEIQSMASGDQLKKIRKHHESVTFSDDKWEDKFWIS